MAREDLRARSRREILPRLRPPRFPVPLPGGPEAGRDQGAGPPSQRQHSCGDGDRGEKVKSCRPLILKGPGFPREPITAAVILVHGWPPAHGCCLQAGTQLPSLPAGAPRGDGLPTCHTGGHHAPRDLGHHELPMEKWRRTLAPSPPAPAGALVGVHQGKPGGQEKRRDGEVAARSPHGAAHVGKAPSSLHSCSQTPLNCNPRAEASPPCQGSRPPSPVPNAPPGDTDPATTESPPAPVPAGGPPGEAEALRWEVAPLLTWWNRS